jgi:cysteine-rich repeat protein
MRPIHRHLTSLVALGLLASPACAEPQVYDPFATTTLTTSMGDGDGDPSTTGDGDGDSTTGDGDGDGDGDPTTGDGDGDGETGDGDGDGDGDPGPLCGNSVVDPGEECDVGVETMFCDGDCTYAMCGDGYHNPLSEACDDGNAANDDGCIGACLVNECGDGVLWMGMEDCDDANMIDTDECKNDCTAAFCGDGVIQDEVETCEDLNMINDDACTNACQIAVCGDGVLWNGMETCDDGNFDDDDDCPGSCEPAFCGDGFVQAGSEECDDGNNVDNDFCGNDCIWNQCQPSGQRAPFNTLNINTASGCWNGNPCPYNNYAWDSTHGQNFQMFGEAVSCTGVPTCVAHVGITTYQGGGNVCQGIWEVYCDGVLAGSINTLGKACAGSAMANTCSITFPGRICSQIELRAAQDNDNTAGCCGGTSPDTMITGVSAW